MDMDEKTAARAQAAAYFEAQTGTTADTLARATFCYPDSAAEPTAFGTAAKLSLIALAEADDQNAFERLVLRVDERRLVGFPRDLAARENVGDRAAEHRIDLRCDTVDGAPGEDRNDERAGRYRRQVRG